MTEVALPELGVGALRLAAMMKALANPTRLAIFLWLAEHPQCQTGEIVSVAGLAQSTVSGHMAVLREAGLVRVTHEGPATCHCVDPEALRWLSEGTQALCEGIRQAAAACCPPVSVTIGVPAVAGAQPTSIPIPKEVES